MVTSLGGTVYRGDVEMFIFSTLLHSFPGLLLDLRGTSASVSSVGRVPGTGGHARHSFLSSDRSEISPDCGLAFSTLD